MSIAVSVLVRPSRIHRILLGACALVQCGLAAALASGAPSPYLGGPCLGLLPALAAAGLACSVARAPKTHRIDISGTAELRVTVQQDLGAGAAQAMILLPGSSIRPPLMVLRYAEPGGPARVLVVWRDAVGGAGWRALAVALGALGRRQAQAQQRKGTQDEPARGGPRRTPRGKAQPRRTEQTTGHVQ